MMMMRLLFIAVLFLASTCAKETETRVCNPRTVLLNLSCVEDLAGADGAEIIATRDDGVMARFVTEIGCPGKRGFEVRMAKNYAEGQTLQVNVTPTTAGVPVGPPTVLEAVRLEPSCTATTIALSARPLDPKVEMDASTEMDANLPPQPDADPLACPLGSLGCPCNGQECASGLVCLEATCATLTCGDGVIDADEECDLGTQGNTGAYGTCSVACKRAPHCGDGIQNGSEECDDGNPTGTDLCSNACAACVNREGFRECGGACLADAECCPGVPCGQPDSCTGSILTPQSVCSTEAKCPAATPIPCDSFLTCADANACRTRCTADDQCTTGRRCVGGTCVTPSCGNGAIEGEDCDDGNKNDLDLCSNACVPCSKRNGYKACGVTCLAAASCCPGEACAPQSCSGATFTPAQTCNGSGQCSAGTPSACPNNLVCEGSSCRPSCTMDAHCANGTKCFNGACITPVCGNGAVEPGEECDEGAQNGAGKTCLASCKSNSCSDSKPCAAGSYCEGGGCKMKKAAGAMCSSAESCGSGNCVDDRCCVSPSCGLCLTCGNAAGTCQPAAAGSDPNNDCPAGGCATGSCNGSGACGVQPSGFVCGPGRCDGLAIAVGPRTCNASGVCQAEPAPVMCTAVKCSKGVCPADCSAGCQDKIACVENRCDGMVGSMTDVRIGDRLVWGDANGVEQNAHAYCRLLGYDMVASYEIEPCGLRDEAYEAYYNVAKGYWETGFAGQNVCRPALRKVVCEDFDN